MMPRLPSSVTGLKGYGLILATAFMVGGLIWLVLSNVMIGLIAVGIYFASGQTALPEDPLELLPGWLAGVGYVVSLGGVALWGVALAWLSDMPQRDALALRAPALRAWPVALALGLTVGLFPSWIASTLVEAWPSLGEGSLALISELLMGGAPWENAIMLGAVVLGAPLLEEAIFRGLLWHSLARHLPLWLVWLGTSLAFAAWHMDPLQSTAVFFTGLFIGAIRWTTGSIWPAVLVHLGNNALAAAGTFLATEDASVSWYVGLAGLSTSTLLVLLSRTPHPQEP
ncbi:MAG: CPBP family intramembrane metalloprotease [Deltaproteobacteria bacterium]|nr:CPBP family intramembrane metalloprotease [Deltaproteobacteria bacterium]